MTKIADISALIDAWPSRKEFAADVGVPLARVHKWAQGGAIPARFHAAVLRACALRGVPVTADDLVRLHDKPERRAA